MTKKAYNMAEKMDLLMAEWTVSMMVVQSELWRDDMKATNRAVWMDD